MGVDGSRFSPIYSVFCPVTLVVVLLFLITDAIEQCKTLAIRKPLKRNTVRQRRGPQSQQNDERSAGRNQSTARNLSELFSAFTQIRNNQANTLVLVSERALNEENGRSE